MKKGTSFLLVFTAFLGITLSSCKMKLEDDNLMDKPGVSVTQSQITVIIPKTSKDTSYVNVYRRDKADEKEVSIGLLYHPYALLNDEKNYTFVDSLVKKTHSYDYRVRYKTNGEYFYSEWSDSISIDSTSDAYADDKVLRYDASGASFLYEPSDCSLRISGSINPAEIADFSDYEPMIVVSGAAGTQAFKLPSIAPGTIYMRSIVTRNFQDTPVKILGIIGQKTTYVNDDPDSNVISVTWTEPETISLNTGASGTITITSQTGSDGLDYRSANSSSPKMTIEQ